MSNSWADYLSKETIQTMSDSWTDFSELPSWCIKQSKLAEMDDRKADFKSAYEPGTCHLLETLPRGKQVPSVKYNLTNRIQRGQGYHLAIDIQKPVRYYADAG